MRTCIFILIISFLSLYSKAQEYAIIKDKDGFVNVRKGPNAKSKIIGKLYSEDIFAYDTESASASWIEIYKQDNKNVRKSVNGYIDKSRIFPLSQFNRLPKSVLECIRQ